MICFKLDILEELKNKGYTTYRLRSEKIISESILTKLRRKDTSINVSTIGLICDLLDCQPCDVIENVKKIEKKA